MINTHTHQYIDELIRRKIDEIMDEYALEGGGKLEGIYLNLYSVLSSEVRPPVAVWNNGGLSLTSRLVPFFKKEFLDAHGITYESTELIQVVKIDDVYPMQWDYLYGNIGTKPHLIIYQSAVGVGGGYRKEIYSEKDNFFIKSLKNVLSNKKGVIQTFAHVMPIGNLKEYSDIDMESTVDITVREVDFDKFNGYTVNATGALSKINTWKFSGKLPASTCWVFKTSDGRILSKEERIEAVKRFKVEQEYQKEVIDLGDLDNEAYE